VAATFRDATRMVTLMAAAMSQADFNVDKLAARAAEGGTTLTELADTLVRDHGLSFRSAHSIAAAVLKAQTATPNASLSSVVSTASAGVLGKALDYQEADLQRIMSPAHFVQVRTTFGGPSPAETGRAIGESGRKLEADRESWQVRQEQLTAAEQKLSARAKAL
jgi:argininosuccinate lyase